MCVCVCVRRGGFSIKAPEEPSLKGLTLEILFDLCVFFFNFNKSFL